MRSRSDRASRQLSAASPLLAGLAIDLEPLVEAIADEVERRVVRLLEAERAKSAPRGGALSVREAAQELRVSENTIGRMIQDGRLASLKVGARRVVPRGAIDAYLATQARA